jgi:phosphatidylserine/phosphatidylglycerophosphate/cardiolipin synthase-like enzyme
MQFLANKDIGPAVTEVLSSASKVSIASAFFCPGSHTLDLLNAIPDLTLIISEEFTINDPAKLEKLTKANRRSVPPDSADGKLHAKVIIADMPDRSTWVLIGSANLTEQGLFYNQEACVTFSSTTAGDRAGISEVRAWFDALLKRSRELDINQAKAIREAQGKQKLTIVSKPNVAAPAYWALKTSEGGGKNSEHWPMFAKEKVVAIGWEGSR